MTPKYVYDRNTHKYKLSKINKVDDFEKFRKKYGFDYIEFFVEHKDYLNKIKLKKPESIKICHLSLIDVPTHMKENREVIIHFYDQQINLYKKWFKEFDLHMPKQWIFIPDPFFKKDLKYLAKEFDELAKKHKVRLNIENETSTTQDCHTFFQASKNTKMCFDIGHAYMRSITKGMNESPLEFFEKVLKYVENIHIMDSRRNERYHHDHIALGRGNLAIKKFLRILKKHDYSGKLTIECLSLEDTRESKKYLDKFFK